MATKVPLVTRPKAQRIAPPTKPEVAAEKEGYVKVRLAYLTHHPKHVRNLILETNFGIQAPYNEDVCILYPAAKVFNDFETYLDTFELLQHASVLHAEDVFVEAKILVEDDLTLAYIIS